jgi:hypothetical protein
MAIVGEAKIIIRADTQGFRKEVRDALDGLAPTIRNAGANTGNLFADSFNSSTKGMFKDFIKESLQAKDAFNKLIKTSYAVGPAIAGVVSTISDLIFGLFSMVAAVGQAAPALGVLGSSMVALAQGGIAAKLAFGGIGKAISALKAPKTGGADNSKAVEDARRRLALAYQRSSDQMAAANDKVRKAQIALNAAYLKGAESLQQLGFEAEDAAISQSKAAIELERARETLMRSQDLPVNDRGRREAEIAFREAELNYRKTLDQVSDLAKAQEYAAATGIEGTSEVLKANEDLAQAEADRAKTTRDNAQDIAEAQRAVAAALASSSSSANALNEAMKKLSPEAQKFAKYIASLEPVMMSLRGAAGKNLFGPLTDAIKNLVEYLVPVFVPILEATGKVIGNFALAFSKMITKPENLEIFNRVFGASNIRILGNFGKAFINFFEAALKVLDALAPLAEDFSLFIVKISKDAKNATGLKDMFEQAAVAAEIIGTALGKLYGGLKEFGKAAAPAGLILIEAFGGVGDKLKIFSEEGNKTGELPKKFMAIAENVKAIGGFLGDVIKGLFDLAGNPAVAEFWTALRPVVPIFVEIGKSLATSGPVIANFIVKVATLLQKFTETGGIENFFNTLSTAVDVLNKIFSNKLIMQAFTFLAAIHGVTLALGTIGSAATLASKVATGKIFGLGGVMLKAKDGASMFAQGFTDLRVGTSALAGPMTNLGGIMRGLVTGNLAVMRAGFVALLAPITAIGAPILIAVAAIAALIAIFVLAYQNSEQLRTAISKMVDILKGSFMKAWENIQDAIGDTGITVESLQDVFKTIGDFIATYFVPLITIIFSGLIQYIGGLIAGVIKVVRGLFDFIGGIVEVFQAIWGLVNNDFDSFSEHMGKALGKFVDGAGMIISGLAAPFIGVWNGIADGWNSTIGKMEITIPDWVPVIGGQKWKPPYLQTIGREVAYTGPKNAASRGGGRGRMNAGALYLAEGGVVRPRSGGVRAVLAEAGRSERVEPLDPMGLSQRDRAIIAQLAGNNGGGGNTFNVFPSQGMDERELAYNVSRNVAWSMKRGV